MRVNERDGIYSGIMNMIACGNRQPELGMIARNNNNRVRRTLALPSLIHAASFKIFIFHFSLFVLQKVAGRREHANNMIR